jgi:cyclic pyranopterin phosphate synthase
MTLSHTDPDGTARMVDVSEKEVTARTALAEGVVVMSAGAFELVRANGIAKGDVLGVARIAGTMGAKRTAELIPLCHPLALDHLAIDATLDPALPGVRITAEARVHGRTGVEMEALTAVAVACLTVYDMVKAVDRGMRIEGIRLVRKAGGKSGTWTVPDRA